VADLPVTFGPWQTVWKRHRRFSADGTWDQIHTRLLVESDSAGQVVWDVSVDSTVDRAHQHATNLARVTGGPVELHNLKPEPADHALGRSRGGLSTEIHSLVSQGRPPVMLVGPGQGGDFPMIAPLLAALSVPRAGPGRPRSRPERVLGNKAYSSRANRQLLRSRGITAVISEPDDQLGHRRRRGSRGGPTSQRRPRPLQGPQRR
jgi:hypothetical protein